ncbi:MAG: hypothetical protein EOP21_10305 [Hyphomicrobiales bacterium]|nr:MAG: hypothetical protein EOP21_10305 [Hyphomicrobiales bacterium]
MHFRTTLIALFAFACPAIAQAQNLSGTYTSDRAGMEQQAIITPTGNGGQSVKLSVSAERCVGKLDAIGRMQGDALVASPPKTDDSCRITIRKTGNGISIDEDKCLYWHGAACEFSGPYGRK